MAYSWNHENRLVGVTLGDQVTTHRYDADGVWLGLEVVSGSEHEYSRDWIVDTSGPLSQIVGALDGNQALEGEYVRGAGGSELIGLLPSDGDDLSYHADGLGSVRALTDPAAGVRQRYAYEAFGEPLEANDVDQPFLFAAEYTDPSLGLTSLRARWLDVRLGSFMGSDPFLGHPRNPATLHQYSYAANNPVLFTDPTGLFLGGIPSMVASLAVRGLVAGAVIGGFVGATVGYHEGVRGNRLEAALTGLIGGAAAGALFGLVGGSLFGWLLVKATLTPLLAFGAFTLGTTYLSVQGSLDLLSRQNAQLRLLGGLSLILSVVAAAFSARMMTGFGVRDPLPSYKSLDFPELGPGVRDGIYIYTVRRGGRINYVNKWNREGVTHDQLAGGDRVLVAGEIAFEGGLVTEINVKSGHYLPPRWSVYVARLILRHRGLWSSGAQIHPPSKPVGH